MTGTSALLWQLREISEKRVSRSATKLCMDHFICESRQNCYGYLDNMPTRKESFAIWLTRQISMAGNIEKTYFFLR